MSVELTKAIELEYRADVKEVEAQCCDNHLLINALALEAFRGVLPCVKGVLVYFISHNIARCEVVNIEVS